MRWCKIEGCDRPYLARGWCAAHYKRWWKLGDPLAPRVRRQAGCTIDGCDREHRARGWCDLHYQRWLRHRDPMVVGKPGPKRNPYRLLDKFIERLKAGGW